MKKELFLLALVFFALGCTTQTQEEKLSLFQGIGIVNIDYRDTVLEGDVMRFSITVRNNALGDKAKNIIVRLDNVEPFKILDESTNEEHSSTDIRQESSSYFDLDSGLLYSEHGTSIMFPGEELEFFWYLKAPQASELSNLNYDHVLYYSAQYSYTTNFTKQITFIDQEEFLRMRRNNEEIPQGIESSTAGPLSLQIHVSEPIIYDLKNQIKPTLSIGFQFSNVGDGYFSPNSIIDIKCCYPKDFALSEKSKTDYGWEESGDNCAKTYIRPEEISTKVIYISLDMVNLPKEPLRLYTFKLQADYIYEIGGNVLIKVEVPK